MSLPSSTATSPVTPSSFSTTASSRSAQVATVRCRLREHLRRRDPSAALDLELPCVPVAPDTINNHVKTCREEQKSLHFFAPEYGGALLQPDSEGAGRRGRGLRLSAVILTSLFDLICSCCQCDHSRGYLFLWNVRLRGERNLILLQTPAALWRR